MFKDLQRINGRNLIVFKDASELATEFTGYLLKKTEEAYGNDLNLSICLSGGTTPQLIFRKLNEINTDSNQWKHTIISWGDERMVPANSDESNYGVAFRLFFNTISDEVTFIKVNGENEIINETARFGSELKSNLNTKNSLPVFNLMLLGVGDDGHTASIFPGQPLQNIYEDICGVASHPKTGQKRISLTMKVINNSDEIFIPVTGAGKAGIIKQIFAGDSVARNYPANDVDKKAIWLLDAAAAQGIL